MPHRSLCTTRSPWRRPLVLCMFLLCLFALPTPLFAQQVRKKFKDTIHIVQRKPVLQKKRFELAPRFGMTFNDALYRHFRVGANANFHITERFFVGALFDWYNFGSALGGPTSAFTQTIAQTNSAPDTPVINWFGGAEIGFVPIFGKFSLFNSGLLFYDVGFTLGGGAAESRSAQLNTPEIGAGITASVFNHIFLNDWISLNFEVRDQIYFATLATSTEQQLAHAVSFSVGFGFFLPTRFEYTEDQGLSDPE